MSLRTCEDCQGCYANLYNDASHQWLCYDCLALNWGGLTETMTLERENN